MGFFDKMFSGLSKTRVNLEELEEIFREYKPLSDEFFEDLEEMLILSDMGMPTVDYVIDKMRYACYINKAKRGDEARECLIEVLGKVLHEASVSMKNGYSRQDN